MRAFFSTYNKLIGALVGNVVAIVLVAIAMRYPTIATCVNDVCTAMGFSQAEITAGAMAFLNTALVWAFPRNRTPEGSDETRPS